MPAPKPSPTEVGDDDEPDVEYVQLSAVEKPERYRKGGYHPVQIGEILGKQYRVVHKLGFGTYSTTWLAADKFTGKYVAIKVGAGYSNPLETDILSCLQTSRSPEQDTIRSAIPRTLDSFEIHGVNGKHPCSVTNVGGPSLERAKLKSYEGLFRLDVARVMAAQLVTAVAHIHDKGVVHGDVSLSNVLFHLPIDINALSEEDFYRRFGAPVKKPVVRVDGQALTSAVPRELVEPVWLGKTLEEACLSDARIMLVDFGESYVPSLQERHDSNAPTAYQPPEALWDSRIPLTFPSDIWTLACSLWDLVAWFPLFKSYFSAQDNVTAEQVAVLGRLPAGWWTTWGRKSGLRRRRFTLDGRPIRPMQYPDLETRFEYVCQQPRRDRNMEAMGDEEREAFLSMLRSMLAFRPEDRITAQQVLESKWIVQWALPEYAKVRSRLAQADSEL